MRIIVCGSRDYDDMETMERALSRLFREFPGEHTIVHGAARGADSMACALVMAARGQGVRRVDHEPHPAQWEKHGKRAGPLRNIEMAELGADLCLAFWDGKSPGTAHMIEVAIKRKIPVRIIPWVKA